MLPNPEAGVRRERSAMEEDPAARDSGPPSHAESGDERARRIEALHALSEGRHSDDGADVRTQQGKHIIQIGTPTRRISTKWTRWLAVVAGALAACVVAVTILSQPRTPPTGLPSAHPTATPIPDPLVIRLGEPGTVCAGQAAWSPDGAEVAVALFATCGAPYVLPSANRPLPSGSAAGARIALYSTLTGYRVRSLDLSPIVSDMVPTGASDDPTAPNGYALIFTGLVWARDGQEMLVSLTSVHAPHDTSTITLDQLFSEKLIAIGNSGDSYITSVPEQLIRHSDPSSAYLWSPHAHILSIVSLPPAISYMWNEDDVLSPAQELGVPAATTTPGPTLAPIGDPGGGSSFTAWQQGVLARPCIAAPDQTASVCCVPSNYVTGSFGTPASWSPNLSDVVIPELGLIGASGVLAAAPRGEIPNACVSPAAPRNQPILPIRDQALAAVIAALPPNDGASAFVAWNSSGLRLATLLGGQSTNDGLSVYDCASGRLLVHVPLAALEQTNAQNVAFAPPQWAHDEQRIMLLDNASQTMIVLGHKTLHL